MSALRALACGAFLAFGIGACGGLEKAAKEDPMKCERDPKCEKKRFKSDDCSTQCNDDPACMDRCAQFQRGSGTSPLGH